jgi:hypothetical protein
VDTRNLTQPPNRSVMAMVIALVALTGVLLVAYVQMFRHAAGELGGSLDTIQASHESSGKSGA